VAALGDDAAQGEHGRVGGEDHELAARRRQLEAAVEGVLQRRHDLDAVAVEAAVGEPQSELGGTRARGDDVLDAAAQTNGVADTGTRERGSVGEIVVQ
jgi:hypothetical protein